MLQRIRDLKKSRRGFTLVEIIVVLVILAILAAFTIPAMLGFVNDARKKAAIAQQREVYVAYQSAVTEVSATNSGTGGSAIVVNGTYTKNTSDNYSNSGGAAAVNTKAKAYLQDSSKDIPTGATFTVTVAEGRVTNVAYTDENGNVLDPITKS